MQERWFPLNALQTHAATEREGGGGAREERSRGERGQERKGGGKNSVLSHLGFLDERCVYVFGSIIWSLS